MSPPLNMRPHLFKLVPGTGTVRLNFAVSLQKEVLVSSRGPIKKWMQLTSSLNRMSARDPDQHL